MPHRIQQRIRRVVAVYLLSMWGTAWAALTAAGPDLLALPWAQACAGVFVSWLGGFAASLGRMLTAGYDNKPFHKAREFGHDTAISTVIGLSGYMGGMSQGANAPLLVLVLLLAGYGGTRTLAAASNRLRRIVEAKE